jgi:hypothetical protein
VLQHFRALQLHLELRDARDRDPHLVVHALPFHQVAGAEDARAGTHTCLVRLALFDRLVGRIAGTSDRRDAERQKRAALRLAEIRLQVGVELRQPRHHREVRRVDHLPGVIRIRMRHDARDPIAVDDHVDVGTCSGRLHVDELPGVDDHVGRGHRRRVLQIEWHRPRLAGFDVHDAQLVERLVEDVVRVAGPAG